MKQLEFDFNEREKQTGVDWLVEELTRQNMYMYLFTKEIEQAKEMEKEQIMNAYVECWKSNMPDGYECKQSAEEYYNETYKNNEQ
jgi:HEPN domain-containing protein